MNDGQDAPTRERLMRIAETIGVGIERFLDATETGKAGAPLLRDQGFEVDLHGLAAAAATTNDPQLRRLLTDIAAALTQPSPKDCSLKNCALSC